MYVTSRGFELPSSAEMDGSLWFNLWAHRLWPYNELTPGDDLWWYETPSQRIVWRTRVAQVEAFAYSSVEEALGRVDAAFHDRIDRTQPYLVGRPQHGFCLAYRVEGVQSVNLPKPPGLKFSQQGWERGDRPDIAAWLADTGMSASGEDGERTAKRKDSNPDWTRDEVVLALDLFVRAGSAGGGPLPGKGDAHRCPQR